MANNKVFPLKRGGFSLYPTTKEAAIAGRARRYDVDTRGACRGCTDYQAHTSEGFQRFTVNDRCALCSNMDSYDLYGILAHKIGFDGKTVAVTSRSYPKNLPRGLSDEAIELYRAAGEALYTDAQRIGPLESWPVPPLNAAEASNAGVKCYLRPECCTVCGSPGVRTLAGDCHYCELRKGQLSPRQEAIKNGETWYTPITPCKKCGTLAERNVFNGGCTGCDPKLKEDQRETAESVMMREAPDLIISREDARAQDLKVYRTGNYCKNGHAGFRYVSTSGCIECKNGK